MEKNNLSVTQLNNYIKGVFDDELILKDISVYGEVSECSFSNSTLFLTIKDDKSVLNCVSFSSVYVPKLGEKVVVKGSVDYYQKASRISLKVYQISPLGEGEQRKKLLQLIQKLKDEGITENRPQMPIFIKSVAVITSETGAVIHDIKSVLSKYHKYIKLQLYPVRVQGDYATEEIVSSIKQANENKSEDIIILARGGGSEEDLSVFNTEEVARAVANSKLPVISSIGHEIDVTLCDICASSRAGTPSIAGENVCRINEKYINNVIGIFNRLQSKIEQIYAMQTMNVYKLSKRIIENTNELSHRSQYKVIRNVSRMREIIESCYDSERGRTINLHKKICNITKSIQLKNEGFLQEKIAQLSASNPLKILSGGYAKVYNENITVTSVDEIDKGDKIKIAFRDGVVTAHIEEIKKSRR